MLLFHDRRSFLKIYSKYGFYKLFLMDLHLKEQYKSRHGSITCIKFQNTYSHQQKSKNIPWMKFDRCEATKRKNIWKKAVISKSIFIKMWVSPHSLKYVDLSMLLLHHQILISPTTGPISIIMALIAMRLFVPILLHDHGFPKHAWSLFKLLLIMSKFVWQH